MSINHYEVLEISRNATDAEIKKSYRRLALKFHPDKNKSASAEEKFKQINDSYGVLSDPVKKAEFDRTYTPRTTHNYSFTPKASKQPSAYDEYERARRQFEEFKKRQQQERKAREEAHKKQADDWANKWNYTDSFYHYSRYSSDRHETHRQYTQESHSSNGSNGWRKTSSSYSFTPGEKTYPGSMPKTEKPSKWTDKEQKPRMSTDFADILKDFSTPEFKFGGSSGPEAASFNGTPEDPIILDSGTKEDPIVVDDPPSHTHSPKKPKQRFWKPSSHQRFTNRTAMEEEGEQRAHKAQMEDADDERFKIRVDNVPPFTQTNGNFNMSAMGESLGVDADMSVDEEKDMQSEEPEANVPPLTLSDLQCNEADIVHISPPPFPEFGLATREQLQHRMQEYLIQVFNYQHLMAKYHQARQEANARCMDRIVANKANFQTYLQSCRFDEVLNSAQTQFLQGHAEVLQRYELELSKYA
ncbi:hypothetical protein KL942_003216 [Ogataea angusta]|uniref:J domain-containing protein n=1 Tax=Pichia angusta TaxID=870730 RepID=A0ABQ7RVW5_PICAN|nr:hypothetical protein KL909_003815 [Ogataea angusta]KAG7833694.1 hypothetical protein KL943_003802 [Ogataea angusta]KAG7839605.1 hypothetical protein KL942_003216 [Ogataea angusta]KAG7849238.1 hypothetical protein KL940_002920 [Ogataea angusta]